MRTATIPHIPDVSANRHVDLPMFCFGFVSFWFCYALASFHFGFVSFWFHFLLDSFRLGSFHFGFVSFWFRFTKYSKPTCFTSCM